MKDTLSPAAKVSSSNQINSTSHKDWTIEKPNLYLGTATPYIAIFLDSSPLVNAITGVNLGAYMSSFNIHLNDKKEDICLAVFDVGDPDAIDLDVVQEGKLIDVQWGYIYPDGSFAASKVHTLKVTTLEVIFDETGTHINLHGSDKSVDLRTGVPYRPIAIEKQTFKDFLDMGMGQETGIIIEKFIH